MFEFNRSARVKADVKIRPIMNTETPSQKKLNAGPADSPADISTFERLGVPANLVAALAKQDITVPTAIQAAAIPELLAGKDLYLHAQTGTGKTLAYLLPLFCKIEEGLAATQAIIVAPTHELAIQIQHLCVLLSQQSGIAMRTLLLIGGTSRERQLEKLKKKPQLVVGSPGRILELIQEGKLQTKAIKSIVVDEADRLMDGEGFGEIKELIRRAPVKRQLIFASATQSAEVLESLQGLVPALTTTQITDSPVTSNIEHFYLRCDERDKAILLVDLLLVMKPARALVFVHRNETAMSVTDRLENYNLTAADLHGAYHKEERKLAMDEFRSGKVPILLASDIAARGLDIKGITHVINLDLPRESSGYLHRIGRTGRAGAQGIAISLITDQQRRIIREFEQELKITVVELCLRNKALHEVARDR